jgi:YVTN family beta-propeller protein
LKHAVTLALLAGLLAAGTGCQMLRPLPPSEPDGPESGACGVEYAYTTVAIDLCGDSICYRFDWGDGGRGDWGKLLPSGEPVTAAHAWSRPGKFDVRAQARDQFGFTSDWSPARPVAIHGREGYPDTVIAVLDGGSDPVGIACAPSGEFIYVAARGDDEVRVYRTSDNSLVCRIPVGDRPNCICTLPDGDRAYVGNAASNDVSVIRLADNTVIATVPVGRFPGYCCALPNGDYVYVTNYGGGTVSVIRTSDNAVVATVPVDPVPWGICPNIDGSRVYVGGSGTNRLTIIRTDDNIVAGRITVHNGPEGMSLSPDGTRLWVACRNSSVGSIDVVRLADGAVETSLPIPGYVVNVIPLPGGEYYYYACHEGARVGVVSDLTRTVVWHSVVASGPCYMAARPDGERVYVCSNYTGKIVVIGRRG